MFGQARLTIEQPLVTRSAVLVIDIAAIFVALGLGAIGIGWAHRLAVKRRAEDPQHQAEQRRRKGAANTVQMHIENAQRCSLCDQGTTEEDLFTEGEWYHRSCYEKFTS